MGIEELIECLAKQEAAFPINDEGLGRLLRDTFDPGDPPPRAADAASAERQTRIYDAILRAAQEAPEEEP